MALLLWTFVHQSRNVSHMPPNWNMTPVWSRRVVFLYELAILCGLVALSFVYYEIGAVKDLVPEPFQGLPVEVAWFGALGGVAISLKGVYDHPVVPGRARVKPWDNSLLLWHLGRPFSGMLAGIVTLVLLEAVSADGNLRDPVILAAAFILGTQESRFFAFIKEVGAVIVAVPQKPNGNEGATDQGSGGTPPS
jgi:hypothetical protein